MFVVHTFSIILNDINFYIDFLKTVSKLYIPELQESRKESKIEWKNQSMNFENLKKPCFYTTFLVDIT